MEKLESINEVSIQYDAGNRAEFATAKELDSLLRKAQDTTPVYICGEVGWLICKSDFCGAYLDYYDVDEYHNTEFGNILRQVPVLESVGELRALLRYLQDDAPVRVCGCPGWFHAPADFTCVRLDCDALEEYYDGEAPWLDTYTQ